MKVPLDSTSSSLEALQSRLQGHVLVGDAAALADVASVVPGSATQRLGIYHHAYRARLQETLRAAFDGLDAPVLALADVAALAPEDWATVVFTPHPTLALITLRCNTLSLWHALDQEAEVPPVEALPSPMDVVVWRFEERPHFRSVLPMEAAALQAMLQGQSFAEICTLLAEVLPEDENAAVLAGGYLRRWIDEGLLTGLTC